MATDPAICSECGAPIPADRFSCPGCGALRASVRGRAGSAQAVAPEAFEPPVGPVGPPVEPVGLPVQPPVEPVEPPVQPASFQPASFPPQPVADPNPIAGGYVAATRAVFPPVASMSDPAPDPSGPVAAPAPPRAGLEETRAPVPILVAAAPIETPYDASGWLVRGGSLATALSFLLPWGASSVAVVGSGAIGYGYFDRWALVNAWYLLPMLLALFVFGLAVVPNRLELWIRSGILPLATGALCLGIAFVYAGGPFGGGPGVLILAAASVASVAGGVIAVRPGRHDGPPPIV